MRYALLSSLAWLGALKSWGPSAAFGTNLEDSARLVAIAGVLGTLTVLIYKLGVWRQQMENTKHNVGAEVKAHREESAMNFGRIERRLDAIDHLVSASAEHRVHAARWQRHTNRRLARLEHTAAGRAP